MPHATTLPRPAGLQPLSREALACTTTAAVLATALAWFGPPGSDMAAHAYQRALFLEHGFQLWNNYWYAGHYSFVTYSLLYYPLAAVLGIRLLAVVTVATAALGFAIVTGREWGPAARWSSRTFAVVWVGILLAAAFPFALGVAFALLALVSLQVRGHWRFGVLAFFTLAASPLAFALLALISASVVLGKRVPPRTALVPAAGLALAAGLELVLWRMFPDNGRYPFSKADLAASVGFGLAGAALLWRVERARVLYTALVVYGLACAAVYLVPSAVGSNITRLQYVALPIAVLVASLRSWRPLSVCVLAVVLATSWNLRPLERSVSQDTENIASSPGYWRPAIQYLRSHLTPSFRVEAVDTVGHWPAQFLPDAGIPLARGWFRQDDYPANALLYRPLTERRYRGWLRSLGVLYVVLSSAQPDYSSVGEAALLESGRSGLRTVFKSRALTVFAVPKPTGMLSGRPGARVERFSQTGLVLSFAHPGRYRLAVRYSPYWQISVGCIVQRSDGMSDVVVTQRGRVSLSFRVEPERVLTALVGRAGRTCGGD